MFLVRGVASSFLFMFRTTATVTWFMVRLPVTVTGSVASGRAVQNVITPAASKPLPVISGSLSDEFKDRITEQAQQDAASEQATLEQFAAQAEANRGLGGSIVAGDPNHGGYPTQWDSPTRQDSMLDNWGMFNRECVSYAAWKVYQTYGNMPYWGGIGNANQWLRNARNAGIPTGAAPKAQSVAISLAGYYGHAMWVEKVEGDMIYVSQYNYDLHGHYSEMWVSASYFTYIYFGDN
jgi:surface antigen